MDFLGMGWFEILVVALVALIVLGPERLPGYARKAGKFIRQFRKITSGVSKEISRAMDMDDFDENEDSIKKDLKAISKSLEEDAAELRRSLTEEARSIEKTVTEGAREASDTLNRETGEIARSIASDAGKAKKEVKASVDRAKQDLGLEAEQSAPSPSASPEQVVAYTPPPLDEQGLPEEQGVGEA
jgi:Tat protein translocase TatB subunit